jgi:hypothetical protein
MIELTNKDKVVGPGFSSGRMREGYYLTPYNTKYIRIQGDNVTYIIERQKSFVKVGDSKFPITFENGKNYYNGLKTNKDAAMLLSSDMFD